MVVVVVLWLLWLWFLVGLRLLYVVGFVFLFFVLGFCILFGFPLVGFLVQQVPRVDGAGVGGRDAPWPHQPGVPTAKGTSVLYLV